MASSLIRGKYLISAVLDDQVEIVEDGAVFQRDGKIIEVGDYDELSQRFRPDAVVGDGTHVVAPGFVNAHHHIGVTPHIDPDISIIHAILHRAKSSDVDTVVVAGEPIYHDGRFTKIDKEAVNRELAESLQRPITPAEAYRRKIVEDIYPYVEAFYRDYY